MLSKVSPQGISPINLFYRDNFNKLLKCYTEEESDLKYNKPD